MADAENKDVARSYVEQVLNQGNIETVDAVFAPDIQFHYPLGDLDGADAVKNYVAAVRTAFPDITFTIYDLIGEGDAVAARWSLAGTQTGEFRGNPPTGNRVSLPGSTIFHFEDGKIKEQWNSFDPARFSNSQD
jgi:steroid delta-isomerase-like uncharacterized protein